MRTLMARLCLLTSSVLLSAAEPSWDTSGGWSVASRELGLECGSANSRLPPIDQFEYTNPNGNSLPATDKLEYTNPYGNSLPAISVLSFGEDCSTSSSPTSQYSPIDDDAGKKYDPAKCTLTSTDDTKCDVNSENVFCGNDHTVCDRTCTGMADCSSYNFNSAGGVNGGCYFVTGVCTDTLPSADGKPQGYTKGTAAAPVAAGTNAPVAAPVATPVAAPAAAPVAAPVASPVAAATDAPVAAATDAPVAAATDAPVAAATDVPTVALTDVPTAAPTSSPTAPIKIKAVYTTPTPKDSVTVPSQVTGTASGLSDPICEETGVTCKEETRRRRLAPGDVKFTYTVPEGTDISEVNAITGGAEVDGFSYVEEKTVEEIEAIFQALFNAGIEVVVESFELDVDGQTAENTDATLNSLVAAVSIVQDVSTLSSLSVKTVAGGEEKSVEMDDPATKARYNGAWMTCTELEAEAVTACSGGFAGPDFSSFTLLAEPCKDVTCSPTRAPVPYELYVGGEGMNCATGYHLEDPSACKIYATENGFKWRKGSTTTSKDRPKGCYVQYNKAGARVSIKFNTATATKRMVWYRTRAICKGEWSFTPDFEFVKAFGGRNCASDKVIRTSEDCAEAAAEMGLTLVGEIFSMKRPGGCFLSSAGKLHFNTRLLAYQGGRYGRRGTGICNVKVVVN